ncbi:MAG: ATP-binding protein [Planctomycetota bacterium]
MTESESGRNPESPADESDAPPRKEAGAPPRERPHATASGDDQLAFFSRLAGGLAHEIKNPLSTMAINLALLDEDWARAATGDRQPSPRELRSAKRVQTLKREVQRLETIVQDFLDFVRGAGVNRRPLNIGDLVQEVLDFVEPENEAAEVRQRADIAFGLPLVLVDEAQIKQALMNLLINARQAMPTGGEVLIRVRRDGNDAEVSITDTGIGMTEEQIERCFDVYWSNKKGGTGLGLPTTKRIVEEHGGALRVISEVGRGTSFLMSLPLAVELAGDRRPSEDGPRTIDVEEIDA